MMYNLPLNNDLYLLVSTNIENNIRSHIILGKKSPKGYEIVTCTVCNDYKERGGFKFEGDDVHYACFNCGCSTGYIALKNKHFLPNKFKEVLTSFGVPIDEAVRIISLNFFKDKTEVVKESKPTGLELPVKEILLPRGSMLVSSNNSVWCEVAELYLNARSMKSSDFAYFVTEETSYAVRLLIPYDFRNKIIYWQGRSMDDEAISPRYKNPSVEKNNIFFNMDELYRYTNEPLFVTEGPIDALSIGRNAVALLGSTLSDFKRIELRKAAKNRRVIFVIDKNLNGKKLGMDILKDGEGQEWYVTIFPDNIEDANDALQKLGRLWLASHLSSTAGKGFHGKLMLELNCSKS